MDTSETCLDIENLQITIDNPLEVLHPVDGLNLTIPPKKVVGLVGESGCGKSMTATAILGLLGKNIHITNGKILFHGEEMSKWTSRKIRSVIGKEIALIFQDPMTSLNPTIRVGKQVEEVLLLHTKLNHRERKQKVIEMFRNVGIPDPEERYKAFPHQLSGGLRQRVVIAMAMICQPKLLIADEPTTALDVTIESQILKLMYVLKQQQDTSILMITHNLGIVSEICDDVYVMYLGEIVEHTNVQTIFKEPLHPYTKGLIACVPSVTGITHKLENIKGTVPDLASIPKGCRLCTRCSHATERCRKEHPSMYEYKKGHYVRCFLYER